MHIIDHLLTISYFQNGNFLYFSPSKAADSFSILAQPSAAWISINLLLSTKHAPACKMCFWCIWDHFYSYDVFTHTGCVSYLVICSGITMYDGWYPRIASIGMYHGLIFPFFFKTFTVFFAMWWFPSMLMSADMSCRIFFMLVSVSL